jgi:hypothetical protein
MPSFIKVFTLSGEDENQVSARANSNQEIRGEGLEPVKDQPVSVPELRPFSLFSPFIVKSTLGYSTFSFWH